MMDMSHAANSSTDSSKVYNKFRNFQLQEEFDTYDPESISLSTTKSSLKKRSKIIEIVAVKDIVFALTKSGIAVAFSLASNKRICFLNIIGDGVIRSLFYNKKNESLITVSVHAIDNFKSLKCRSTPIEYIKRNQLDAGVALFETELLVWPGFVEFDDVNGKAITYSPQDSIYKVFDLKDYSFLYSISDKNVQDIKISPGTLLVISHRDVAYVPLRIISIDDGTLIKSLTHSLHPKKKVDFIELFCEKLLIKQENENLQILNVSNSEVTEVNQKGFLTPSAFIFLYEKNLFLTFRNRTVSMWNLLGKMVTSFEDHLLWNTDCNTNAYYFNSDQDIIFSYCMTEGAEENGECAVGSINISNILSGKCIAKICSSNPNLRISPRGRMGGRSVIQSSVREALEDVTVVFYNEDRNEVYSGNSKGLLHVWSNAPITSKI